MVDGTYSATEGWMTVPVEAGHLGGVLHPGAHIVEFIEEGKEVSAGNLIPCWALEANKSYAVFLTTAMGFVRYQLGDIVRCTGFYNRSPRLEFVHKEALLKLEPCAISEQELQQMLQEVHFKMAPHWYFVRNAPGDGIVLVTDDESMIEKEIVQKMHQALIRISETYAYNVELKTVLPMEWLPCPKEVLLKNTHAQSKPKLIALSHEW
jgi:hypothetical protein